MTLIVLGCSDDGLGKRYPVSGMVTYKGASVEKGQVDFVPDGGSGRAASGAISNGRYSLATLGDNDGAMPGKYKVTVSSKEIDLSAAQEKAKKAGTGVALPQEYTAKAARDAKNLIPAKYSLPSTSDLSVEVKEQSNTINLELKD